MHRFWKPINGIVMLLPIGGFLCELLIEYIIKVMAKKNKDARVQVILECTEQKTSGVPGMSRYVTMKNKKNTPERLELKKYNPFLKKVTVHKEIK